MSGTSPRRRSGAGVLRRCAAVRLLGCLIGLGALSSLDVILAWHQVRFGIGNRTAVRIWSASYRSRFDDLIANISALVLSRGIRDGIIIPRFAGVGTGHRRVGRIV